MGERDDKIYGFGDFRLQTEDGTLWRGADRVAATQKAIEILTTLLENPGRVISREEIIERLWPDTYVDENNLAVTVSMLRKALAPQTFIETVPRKGYRFNGKVAVSSPDVIVAEREYTRTVIERTEIEDDSPHHLPARLGGRATRRWIYLTIGVFALAALGLVLGWSYFRGKTEFPSREGRSVAVLPFRDLSNDEKGGQFSIGLADSLITKLAGIRGLSVRPVSAVMPLAAENLSARAAGEKLNVEAVLEGTIQRDGDNYRVSVQLVNTRDQQVLWANVLEEKSSNLFAFQKLLSSQVADALAFKLTNSERSILTRQPTENAEAYREYLLGRFFWNKRTSEDLPVAKTHFEKAVALDPSYAEAHSGLGATYMLLGDSSFAVLTPAESYPKAREHALRALELDDSIAEAYAVLGQTRTGYEWDVEGGERSLRRAIELNPSSASARQWLGWNLILQKRFSESSDAFARAAELDPTSLVIASEQGYPAFFSADYDTAVAKFAVRWRLTATTRRSGSLFGGRAFMGESMPRQALSSTHWRR